ncbi:hypothetical protein FGO68_gene10953 [Halteria grandinella]|uniref:Uncharacterized protein n=1 Tax=Halteria grandinella TaxID=5974 RepID=A0A8J8P5X8_HALGN|nr:hypothetical protein FGO68_gene10953 [Halteria grandinella]
MQLLILLKLQQFNQLLLMLSGILEKYSCLMFTSVQLRRYEFSAGYGWSQDINPTIQQGDMQLITHNSYVIEVLQKC